MSLSKPKRTTTRNQFELIIEKMMECPDIARNDSKRAPEEVQHFWESLRSDLNSIGPPEKEIADWKKVWSDHKSALRKKLAHNKRELLATGGGENNFISFTPLEESVIQLLHLKDSIEGLPRVHSFGLKRRAPPPTIADVPSTTAEAYNTIDEEDHDVNAQPSSAVFEISASASASIPSPPTPSSSSAKKPRQLQLFEEQVSMQKQFYKDLTNVIKEKSELEKTNSKYLKEMCQSLKRTKEETKKLAELKSMELDETKRHNLYMEKMAFEKNKLKKMILEIELKKVNEQLTK